MSTAASWVTPASRQAMPTSWPMGPAPKIATRWWASMPATRRMCTATARGSHSTAFSVGRSSGTWCRRSRGTSTYWAKQPLVSMP